MKWFLLETTQMKVWAACKDFLPLETLKEELSNDPEFADANFIVSPTDCGCAYSSKAVEKELKRILEYNRRPKKNIRQRK
jgi:hypothetical protein